MLRGALNAERCSALVTWFFSREPDRVVTDGIGYGAGAVVDRKDQLAVRTRSAVGVT